jgi:hypothetical protein
VRRVDLKYAFATGLAFVGLANFLSDETRLLAGLLGFAIVAVSAVVSLYRLAVGLAAASTVPVRWPDFKVLDDRKDFELYEAACLWFDKEPILPMFDEALGIYQQWKQCIEAGDMPTHASYDPLADAINISLYKHPFPKLGSEFAPVITPHLRISRGILKAWCEATGHRPRFLYPERRGER